MSKSKKHRLEQFYGGRRPTFYLCNGKRCSVCAGDCKYTSNVEYALYPDHDDFFSSGDAFWQKEPKQKKEEG